MKNQKINLKKCALGLSLVMGLTVVASVYAVPGSWWSRTYYKTADKKPGDVVGHRYKSCGPGGGGSGVTSPYSNYKSGSCN